MNYLRSKLFGAKGLVALFSTFILLISACSKDSNSNTAKEETLVKINMSGVGTAVDNNSGVSPKSSTQRTATDNPKTTIIPFNDEYSIVATVTPSNNKTSNRTSSATSNGTKAAVVEDVQSLKPGTNYTIAVYSSTGAYVTHQSFTYTTGQTPQFSLPPASYRFIAVASGNNTLPTINFNQPLAAINWDMTDAAMDVMYFNQILNVQQGATNVLDVVLKHKFTEVEVTVDSKAIGTAQVASGTVTSSYPQANFALEGGTMTYNGAASGSKAINFPTNTGTLIKSTPVFLFSKNDIGNISVPVTIAGTTKPVSTSVQLALGVRYEITFRIQRNGINIGGEIFSPGNLLYDHTTGEYSFAPSTGNRGDYFFPNYVKAKKMNVGNLAPNTTDNGPTGDPCKLVYPQDYWRLPTEAEATTLINSITPPGGGGNWTPFPFQNNSHVDNFDGTINTDLGIFYGIQQNPGNPAREQYLFLAFGGYYENTDVTNTVGQQGRLLLTATAGGHTTIQSGGSQGTRGYTQLSPISPNAAVQVRCLKN